MKKLSKSTKAAIREIMETRKWRESNTCACKDREACNICGGKKQSGKEG